KTQILGIPRLIDVGDSARVKKILDLADSSGELQTVLTAKGSILRPQFVAEKIANRESTFEYGLLSTALYTGREDIAEILLNKLDKDKFSDDDLHQLLGHAVLGGSEKAFDEIAA